MRTQRTFSLCILAASLALSGSALAGERIGPNGRTIRVERPNLPRERASLGSVVRKAKALGSVVRKAKASLGRAFTPYDFEERHRQINHEVVMAMAQVVLTPIMTQRKGGRVVGAGVDVYAGALLGPVTVSASLDRGHSGPPQALGSMEMNGGYESLRIENAGAGSAVNVYVTRHVAASRGLEGQELAPHSGHYSTEIRHLKVGEDALWRRALDRLTGKKQ